MKYLLQLAFVFLPIFSFAQFGATTPNPVKWEFKLIPQGENTYKIQAVAQIEKGFHIFALDAGGDGTLISTEFELEDGQDSPDAPEWTSVPKPKTIQLDFIDGDIYWHENKVTFNKTVIVEDADAVSGQVNFQVCNEEKCLPPATETFTLKLKK